MAAVNNGIPTIFYCTIKVFFSKQDFYVQSGISGVSLCQRVKIS